MRVIDGTAYSPDYCRNSFILILNGLLKHIMLTESPSKPARGVL